ncbi:MAG TPA: cytochrome c biogenesis protein CcdA [Symbiobacteriaceae bacterium]|jgi:cytochrome c-type biogenesis protein|nr:cytochrome c biogenesis protein CcdA [Symbiobacteriaceae bacterium]
MGRAQGCPHHQPVDRNSRLRTLVSLFILGAAAVWVAVAVFAGEPGQTAARPEVGAPAPAITGTTLDRKQVSLADFAGRPLVVNFFASWCDPCKEEAPVLKAMADEAAAKGYAMLGVAIQDERAAAAQFMQADGLTFPAILDDGRAARAYRIVGPPTTFFIDAGGVIRHVYMGPLTAVEVEAGLEKAAAGAKGAGQTGGGGVPNLALAFGLGLLSFLSPCVLPLLPAYTGYISGISAEELAQGGGPQRRRRVLGRVLAFALGLILVFTALGASASLISGQLTAYRPLLARVSGLLVLAFGLHMTGLLRLSFLQREFRPGLNQSTRNSSGGSLGALAMGAAFGLGWTPCVGPVLGTILVLASQEATVGQAVRLLLAYGLGMGIPFVLAGLAMDRVLGALSGVRRHLGLIERLSGVLLVLMGFLLVADRLGALGLWLNRVL